MRRAFGVGRDEFQRAFLEWARGEVRAWGLDPDPPLRTLAIELSEGDEEIESALRKSESERLEAVARAWCDAIGRPGGERFNLRAEEWPPQPMPDVRFDDATVRAFLAKHPDQPDLVELLLRRARGSGTTDTAETRTLLERYATLRPVDPLPHRIWARLAGTGLDSGGDDAALRHLRELDLRADKDNIYALAIARNRRAAKDFPAAVLAAERAVRMNPFDASVRELAASIAVEGARLDLAETHIEALTALEPDRGLHRQRLERIRAMRAANGG